MTRGMDIDRLWGQWVNSHEEGEPSLRGFEPPKNRRLTHRCMPTVRVDLARSLEGERRVAAIHGGENGQDGTRRVWCLKNCD